ncbi:MAG: Uma2 family endonuclease [Myxococcota bacterium]
MVAQPHDVGLSYAQYLALEGETHERFQFLDGEVFAMAGGTLRHAKLIANLTAALGGALGDGPCQAYSSDAKLRVAATGLATYPDLSVICGAPETHPEDPNAATNPALVAEVLSPSTEAWDRGGKFHHLKQVQSLRHYLLVSVDAVRVERFERADHGTWTYREHGAGETVELADLGVTFTVDALYRNLPE